MRKENLSVEHRDGDWQSNCKRTILTNNQQYQKKVPTIVGPNMTEKKEQQSVLQLASHSNKSGSIKMLFFKNETKHWWTPLSSNRLL